MTFWRHFNLAIVLVKLKYTKFKCRYNMKFRHVVRFTRSRYFMVDYIGCALGPPSLFSMNRSRHSALFRNFRLFIHTWKILNWYVMRHCFWWHFMTFRMKCVLAAWQLADVLVQPQGKTALFTFINIVLSDRKKGCCTQSILIWCDFHCQ